MHPLQAHRYFCRWCFTSTNRRSTTVISSESSVWPGIALRVPPHCGHVRSAAASSCTISTVGRFGCALGPWPRRGVGGVEGLLQPRMRAPLRRGVEQRPLALGEELLQEVELALGREGGLAAQPGEFGDEGLDLGVEFLVLALEKHRDLTQQLRITDLIEPQHVSTTSSSRAASKNFLPIGEVKRRRRECDAPDEDAAFEEQMQFAHGEAHDARVGLPPQTREAALLQVLIHAAAPGVAVAGEVEE